METRQDFVAQTYQALSARCFIEDPSYTLVPQVQVLLVIPLRSRFKCPETLFTGHNTGLFSSTLPLGFTKSFRWAQFLSHCVEQDIPVTTGYKEIGQPDEL